MDRRIARSRAQERRGAAQHNGRRTPGSGNGVRKGDVRLDRGYLVEYKRTDGRQITIKLVDLETNRRNALAEGREPLLGIEIGGRDYMLVPAGEFERLRSAGGSTGSVGGTMRRPQRRPDVPRTEAEVATAEGEGVLPRRPQLRAVSRPRGVS